MFFEELLANPSFKAALWGIILIAVFILFSKLKKEKSESLKLFLFWSMTVVIVFVTLFIAGRTVHKNITSISGGPIHWHADFKIFNCGEELDLVDPRGLVNRIGTSVLHEHGDNRIHVEGVLEKREDASLSSFFEVIGGEMKPNILKIPTNEGFVTMGNGNSCNGERGVLQVFKYSTDGTTIKQEKLSNFTGYVLKAESIIPPGDCLIIEFDRLKNKTNNICKFYEIEINKGNLEYN